VAKIWYHVLGVLAKTSVEKNYARIKNVHRIAIKVNARKPINAKLNVKNL
jgi:hypothetical protein